MKTIHLLNYKEHCLVWCDAV